MLFPIAERAIWKLENIFLLFCLSSKNFFPQPVKWEKKSNKILEINQNDAILWGKKCQNCDVGKVILTLSIVTKFPFESSDAAAVKI